MKNNFKLNLKKYLIIFNLLLLYTLSMAFFSGCTLFGSSISPPEVAIDYENKTLVWEQVSGYDYYNVYLNDNLLGVANSSNIKNDMYVYSFESKLDEKGLYNFTVQAISSSGIGSSELSEVATYAFGNTYEIFNTDFNFLTDSILGNTTITQNENIISWTENTNCSYYVINVFSNSLKNASYKTNDLFFDLRDINQNNDLIMCNIGCVYSNKDIVYYPSNDFYYYNPNKANTISSNYYYFDEMLNDDYIESTEELSNILYYNFIERTQEYTIRISPEFADEICGEETVQSERETLISNCINNAFSNSFLETSSYLRDRNSICTLVYNNDYKITLDFFNIKECSLGLNYDAMPITKITQLETTKPYYETYDFKTNKRTSTYNDFESDKKPIKISVSTSDELYWAVECGATPICEENSRAELIYNEAKNVLREIICNNMTDYEKALCIYDWIISNTTYFTMNMTSSELTTLGLKTTNFPCFYLEGVFVDHMAVCDGFSKAYSLLCNMEGLPCIRITGTATNSSKSENHAWNKVQISYIENSTTKTEWFIVDTTWAEFRANSIEKISHKYFLTTDDLLTSHNAFSGRTKYRNYETSETPLTYYQNTYLKFTNSNGNTITQNLFIDSDNDLKNIVEYCVQNGYSYIDAFLERNYANSECNTGSNFPAYNCVKTVLSNNISSSMYIVSASYESKDLNLTQTYLGCIIVININLIVTKGNVDVNKYLDNLLSYYSNALTYSNIDLDLNVYFSKNYLDSIKLTYENYNDKIEALETDYTNYKQNYTITFEYSGETLIYNNDSTAYLVHISFNKITN